LYSGYEVWRLRLFSFCGYGLAHAALALVVFGAYDSYPMLSRRSGVLLVADFGFVVQAWPRDDTPWDGRAHRARAHRARAPEQGLVASPAPAPASTAAALLFAPALPASSSRGNGSTM